MTITQLRTAYDSMHLPASTRVQCFFVKLPKSTVVGVTIFSLLLLCCGHGVALQIKIESMFVKADDSTNASCEMNGH